MHHVVDGRDSLTIALSEWNICWRYRTPSGVTVTNSWMGLFRGKYDSMNLPCRRGSLHGERKYGILQEIRLRIKTFKTITDDVRMM